MRTRKVTLIAGTPTFTWCDQCLTNTRAHFSFHTLSASGVTKAIGIDRCVNERHADE